MPESAEYTAAKAAFDSALANAIAKHGDIPMQPCSGAGEQASATFGSSLTLIGSKLVETQNLSNALAPGCAVPPPSGGGQSNIFGRLSFAITYESALGFSQASDVTFNRRTGKPVIIDQLNRIVFVDLQGATERSVTIDASGLPDPKPNHDWEAIEWVGDDGTADEFVICFEPAPARLYWVKVPYNATSIALTPATEMYSLPGLTIEAIACDYHTPGTVHAWTYGSTTDTHAIITRGNPTTHVTNSLYPTHSWVPGFRSAFWNTDYCPNPIKVGCSLSDVTLRELNHTDPSVPYGSVVSSSPTFNRSNRKFEGGCFLGSEKKICLVAENGPTNFFILEAP